MKKFLSVLILAALLLTAACAEGKICATGSATVYVPADFASISLGIYFTGKDLAELQQQANATIDAVCDALEKEGVAKRDISTGYFYISPEYNYNSDTRELTGYTTNYSLTIVTQELDRVGAYIDAAFVAGANNFDSVSFSLRNDSQARAEALRQAIADAQAKAALMAEAAGCELGGLTEVRESSAGSYYTSEYASNDMIAKTEEAAAGTTIHAAQIAVSAGAEVVYEIK